ncbi:YaeQ family protein [Geobacter grbiciae]|uniref:YaeQ family protein n=1 Tax=Geobacter grbiciae TaxID=155042 RepID=UPI001C02FBFE|nr:YaeQ family protein [Geobacter grbiciae]MBT1074352.1 YaeQ family protein [Geobacter grbiciae]
MALPSTIYKASLQLSDIDRGVYESLQATVAKHPSETDERLVARLLAWAIFHEPELSFTKGLCVGEEPDLWVKGPDGRVRFWVEVGLPESDRIIKASRHTEKVALLACGRALANWDQQHLPRLTGLPNLTVVSLDQAFITTLAARLERSITWSVTITEGTVYLEVDGVTHETGIRIKTGALL